MQRGDPDRDYLIQKYAEATFFAKDATLGAELGKNWRHIMWLAERTHVKSQEGSSRSPRDTFLAAFGKASGKDLPWAKKELARYQAENDAEDESNRRLANIMMFGVVKGTFLSR
jgi:hypothetical protein